MSVNLLSASTPAKFSDRLLRTPSPQPCESLMGYIIRLTEQNHYDSPRWILELAGLKLNTLVEGWQQLCYADVDFSRFKQITGLSDLEVEALRFQIGYDQFNREYIPNWDLPLNAIIFSHPKVCCYCLRESNYCHKLWDLLPITACWRHAAILLDKCPTCRKRLSWNRNRVNRCRCGQDLRAIELMPASQVSMERIEGLLTAWKILGSAGIDEFESPNKRPEPLDNLSFGDLCCAFIELAKFYLIIEPDIISAATENELWHRAFETVQAIFQGWPYSFYQVCKRALAEDKLLTLSRQLDALVYRERLAFLRVALEEYIASVAPDLLTRRFISTATARERLNLSPEGFEKLLATGKLRTTNSIANEGMMLVDEKSIDELMARRKELLSVEAAAKALGIMSEELLDMISHECLPVASGPQQDGFQEIGLEVEAIIDLYNRVEKLAKPINKNLLSVKIFGPELNLNRLRIQLSEEDISFGQWMKAVINGELTPLKLKPLKQISLSLRNFAFSPEQFDQFVEKHFNGQSLALAAWRSYHIRFWKQMEYLFAKWEAEWQRESKSIHKKSSDKRPQRGIPRQGGKADQVKNFQNMRNF